MKTKGIEMLEKKRLAKRRYGNLLTRRNVMVMRGERFTTFTSHVRKYCSAYVNIIQNSQETFII